MHHFRVMQFLIYQDRYIIYLLYRKIQKILYLLYRKKTPSLYTLHNYHIFLFMFSLIIKLLSLHVNLKAYRPFALQYLWNISIVSPSSSVSLSLSVKKSKRRYALALPRYGRNAAVGRDLCIYSVRTSVRRRWDWDVILWQGPKSREKRSMWYCRWTSRVVLRCRCNNPRRSYRHTYTPTYLSRVHRASYMP